MNGTVLRLPIAKWEVPAVQYHYGIPHNDSRKKYATYAPANVFAWPRKKHALANGFRMIFARPCKNISWGIGCICFFGNHYGGSHLKKLVTRPRVGFDFWETHLLFISRFLINKKIHLWTW